MANTPQMTKSQLRALVKKAAEETSRILAKADPGQEAPSEETPDGSASASAASTPSGDGAPPSDGPPADASAGGDAPPSDGGDPAQDTGADVTPESLLSEYSELGAQSVDQLKMHIAAATAALQQLEGGQQGSAPPSDPGAASSPPTPPPAGPPSPDGGMGKAEKVIEDAFIKVMSKSEEVNAKRDEEFKALTETVSKLDKSIAIIAGALQGKGFVPQPKSVASVTDIRFTGKPGTSAPVVEMNKSEATEKLKELTKSTRLSPKDAQLVSQFCVGKATVAQVAHLLK